MITKFIKVPIYANNLNIVITDNFTEDLNEINKKYYNNFNETDNVLGFNQ